MREIKFRAWDFQENKMISWDELTSGKHPYNYLSMLRSSLGIVLFQQYTGLKDKNGKEIYEGDVVKTKSEGTFAIEWSTVGCDYHGGVGFAMGSENPIPSFYEVIGNIHENPELLK